MDAEFERNFNYFLDILDSGTPAIKVSGECRFCDIGKADCPERIEITAKEGWEPQPEP